MRVDTRAGSRDIIEPLRWSGVTVEEATLPAGDIEIVGLGPEGRPILVGCEYKTVEDAVACARNGRFADQMRAMRESFEVKWLLIEGRVRGVEPRQPMSVKRENRWFELPGHMTYQEWTAWVLTMAQCGGMQVWRTDDKAQTVQWLRSLEMWWTAKAWDEHRAHLDWYTPPIPSNPFEGPPPLVRRWASELPRIGVGKSLVVAKHFGSARKMACASVDDWCSIPQVGKRMASAIVAAIEEEAK